MKSRCSLGRVMLAAWCLMLCLGFVIATSLEVTAEPIQDGLGKVAECTREVAACETNCSASGLSPQAVANCKSNCNRACQTGQAIKPSNKARSTAPIPKQGLQRRGVEPESPTGNQEKAQQGDKKE